MLRPKSERNNSNVNITFVTSDKVNVTFHTLYLIQVTYNKLFETK